MFKQSAIRLSGTICTPSSRYGIDLALYTVALYRRGELRESQFTVLCPTEDEDACGGQKISFDRYILYRDRYSTINQSTG